MEKSFQPQEIHPDPAPAARTPSPAATASPSFPDGHCQRCGAKNWQLRGVSNVFEGRMICESCHQNLEFEALEAERAARSARQEAERALHPVPAIIQHLKQQFCAHEDCAGHVRRPVAGVDRDGVLCCEQHLLAAQPEPKIVELERRLLLVEKAMEAQQAPKTARKS